MIHADLTMRRTSYPWLPPELKPLVLNIDGNETRTQTGEHLDAEALPWEHENAFIRTPAQLGHSLHLPVLEASNFVSKLVAALFPLPKHARYFVERHPRIACGCLFAIIITILGTILAIYS
jgi:hypothetical protein